MSVQNLTKSLFQAHYTLSSNLPGNDTQTVIMERTVDVCGNLKRKFKQGDLLYKSIHHAFHTKTNITSFCPLYAGVYGCEKFRLDFEKFPLQLSSDKYNYTFTGKWYSMIKDKSGGKIVQRDIFNVNFSYHFEN